MGESFSEFVRESALNRVEEAADLQAYREAIEEDGSACSSAKMGVLQIPCTLSLGRDMAKDYRSMVTGGATVAEIQAYCAKGK